MDAEKGELGFSYSGEWIMDAARSAYWFENRRKWAIDLLKCVKLPREYDEDQIFYMKTRGLTFEQICEVAPQAPLNDEQIMAILNGKAILTDDSKFGRVDDAKFLKTLGDWQGEMAEVGDRMVRRETLEAYFNSLERSRNANEAKPAYERVLFEAGLTRIADSRSGKTTKVIVVNTPESLAFRSALLKLGEIHMRAKEQSK